MIVIEIIGILCLILLFAQIAFIIYQVVLKKTKYKNEMIVYADVPNTLGEEIPIFIVDNIMNEEFRNAHNKDIAFYAAGFHIPGVAFKSHDYPNGIRVALTGITESTMSVIHALKATKYNLWEISFDKGVTKHSLLQVSNPKHSAAAIKFAQNSGWEVTSSREKITEEIIKKSNRSKMSLFTLDELDHKILASFNESLSTPTTMRVQFIAPNDEVALYIAGGAEKPIVNYFYTYNGNLYKFKSRFLKKTGSLYDFELYDLEPGKVYVGIAFELNNNGLLMPSTTIYGLTKNEDGTIPTFDEAALGMPKEDDKKYPLWSEKITRAYLGDVSAEAIYKYVAKKHYENDNPDEYIAMAAIKTIYTEYDWLLSGSLSPVEEEEILKQIDIIKNDRKQLLQ